jgi:hypothetical protein
MSQDYRALFEEAIRQLCDRVQSECDYPSHGLRRKIAESGGAVSAAKTLLQDRSSRVKTVEWVWKHKRPDLTVDSIIIERDWGGLFAPDEIAKAQSRYEEYVQAAALPSR